MNFTHYDLGNLERGRYVRVTLEGNAANVLLLDDKNYQNYAAGQPYHYIGGLAQRSPVHFQTPQTGHWHISVNLDGLGGSVRAGVTLLYPKAGMTVPNLMMQQNFNPGQNLPTVQKVTLPQAAVPTPPPPRAKFPKDSRKEELPCFYLLCHGGQGGGRPSPCHLPDTAGCKCGV